MTLSGSLPKSAEESQGRSLDEMTFREKTEKVEPRPGGWCPLCQQGTLDYNGCLELSCPQCGFTSGGGFT